MRRFQLLIILAIVLAMSACQDPAVALEGMRVALPSPRSSGNLGTGLAEVAAPLAEVSGEAYAPPPSRAPSTNRDDGPHVLTVQSPLYQQITSEYAEKKLPDGFAYAEELIPQVLLEPRYAGENNFMAQVLPGYAAPKVVVSLELGTALAAVQEALLPMGLGLKIYDAYRPLQAEEEMQSWAVDDSAVGNKEYYPRLEKQQILSQGYVAVGTGHTRGAAVDLTLIDLECGCELDMGSGFDIFDTISHTMSEEVEELVRENRLMLKTMMEMHGFRNFAEEWWHYNLVEEPYPGQSFRFVIE